MQKNDAKLDDTMNEVHLIRDNGGTSNNLLQILLFGVIHS